MAKRVSAEPKGASSPYDVVSAKASATPSPAAEKAGVETPSTDVENKVMFPRLAAMLKKVQGFSVWNLVGDELGDDELVTLHGVTEAEEVTFEPSTAFDGIAVEILGLDTSELSHDGFLRRVPLTIDIYSANAYADITAQKAAIDAQHAAIEKKAAEIDIALKKAQKQIESYTTTAAKKKTAPPNKDAEDTEWVKYAVAEADIDMAGDSLEELEQKRNALALEKAEKDAHTAYLRTMGEYCDAAITLMEANAKDKRLYQPTDDELIETFTEAQGEKEKAEKALEETQERLEKANEQFDIANQALTALSKKDKGQKDLEALQAEVDKLRKNLKKKEGTRESLKKTKGALETRKDEKYPETLAQKAVKRLREEAPKAKAKLDSIKEKIAAAYKKIDSLERSVKKIEDNHEITQEIPTKEVESTMIEDGEARAAQLFKDIDGIASSITGVSSALGRKKGEIKKANDKLNEAIEAASGAQAIREAMNNSQEARNVEAAEAAYETAKENAEKRLGELLTQLAEKQAQLKALENFKVSIPQLYQDAQPGSMLEALELAITEKEEGKVPKSLKALNKAFDAMIKEDEEARAKIDKQIAELDKELQGEDGEGGVLAVIADLNAKKAKAEAIKTAISSARFINADNPAEVQERQAATAKNAIDTFEYRRLEQEKQVQALSDQVSELEAVLADGFDRKREGVKLRKTVIQPNLAVCDRLNGEGGTLSNLFEKLAEAHNKFKKYERTLDPGRGLEETMVDVLGQVAEVVAPSMHQALDEVREESRNALTELNKSRGHLRNAMDENRALKKKLRKERRKVRLALGVLLAGALAVGASLLPDCGSNDTTTEVEPTHEVDENTPGTVLQAVEDTTEGGPTVEVQEESTPAPVTETETNAEATPEPTPKPRSKAKARTRTAPKPKPTPAKAKGKSSGSSKSSKKYEIVD